MNVGSDNQHATQESLQAQAWITLPLHDEVMKAASCMLHKSLQRCVEWNGSCAVLDLRLDARA